MQHTYTLICYRPNGAVYFRGEVDDASNSKFEYVFCHSAEEVAKHWAEWRMQDQNRTAAVCPIEVTLLIDGLDEDKAWQLDNGATWHLYEEVRERSNATFVALQEEAKEKARLARIAEEETERQHQAARQLAHEASERAELQRLLKKYPA